MAKKEPEVFTFHNENVLLGVARWAKVVGWAIAAVYFLSFVNDLTQTFASGGLQQQLSSGFMGILLFLANLIYPITIGAFYWLVMHGLAQGLYVALDLFITTEEDEPEEGIVP
jgi:hypothetical protein